MKKGLIPISIVVVFVLFSCVACAKSPADLLAKQAAEEQMSGSQTSGESSSSDKTASTGSQQSASGTDSGVTVISKSDNVYTDAQKQQTLNELTGEIDKLIESINSLDEVQDSELTFEEE